ncbi:MAG: SBBP repeat-containing protein [bacterium]|nr:SBBP repeat-containing protein [Candidatus Kapabacteria bacterium]
MPVCYRIQIVAVLALATALCLPLAVTAQTPTMMYSTYIGGIDSENLRDIATDSAGNMYVTGGTSSPDFPTTPGAYDRTFATGGASLGTGGPMDVFVTKLTPQGVVIWSTLLGGPNYDRAYAIEVDRQGFVYVGGRAGEGFPTTSGVVQPMFAGDSAPNRAYGKQDPFVAKLSPDGSSLVWATYFGADDAGIIRDFDIDSVGNVFVAALGSVNIHPHITAGAFQTTKPGNHDMVVAKLSADARRVIWASYLGGSLSDGAAPSIRVDEAGHAYIIGTTSSLDLPVTATAYDTSYNGGRTDHMVAKFLPDGSGVVYLTYFGGSGAEDLETHSIVVDRDGNAYICGYTTSPNLPVTSNALQRVYGGGYDIPLAKFSSDGSQLLACSYLGGASNDGSQGIGLSDAGDIVVGGETQSADFPTTPDAYQRTYAGGGDVLVAKLSGDYSTLRYSTFLGGAGKDDGRTAWMDRNGTFYVAGHSNSSNYPTLNPIAAWAGDDDGIITKFTATTVSSVNEQASSMRLQHSLSPNPAHSNPTLEFTLAAPASVIFELVDLNGRVIISRTFDRVSTANLTLDVNDVATGLYLYRLIASSGAASEIARGSVSIIGR